MDVEHHPRYVTHNMTAPRAAAVASIGAVQFPNMMIESDLRERTAGPSPAGVGAAARDHQHRVSVATVPRASRAGTDQLPGRTVPRASGRLRASDEDSVGVPAMFRFLCVLPRALQSSTSLRSHWIARPASEPAAPSPEIAFKVNFPCRVQPALKCTALESAHRTLVVRHSWDAGRGEPHYP